MGSKLNCDRPVLSSWHDAGNVGEGCGDKDEDEDDDMDDSGGVVVAEIVAVEDSVKIPIFGRDTI